MSPPGTTLWAATASSACQDSQGSVTLENHAKNIHIEEKVKHNQGWIDESFQCRDSSWLNLDPNAEAGGCVPINGIHNMIDNFYRRAFFLNSKKVYLD